MIFKICVFYTCEQDIYNYSYFALKNIPALKLDDVWNVELRNETYCVILIYRVRHGVYGSSLQSLLLFPQVTREGVYQGLHQKL